MIICGWGLDLCCISAIMQNCRLLLIAILLHSKQNNNINLKFINWVCLSPRVNLAITLRMRGEHFHLRNLSLLDFSWKLLT